MPKCQTVLVIFFSLSYHAYLYRASLLKLPLFLAAEFKLIGPVIHALAICIHSLWALVVELLQSKHSPNSNVR